MNAKQSYITGFIKAARAAGVPDGVAADLLLKLSYDGASKVEVNSFAPADRRQLSDEENTEVTNAKKKVLPKFFMSMADPLTADMSSPGWAGAAMGGLGAGAGGLLGAAMGGSDHAGLGAGIGALLGGGVGGVAGYKGREAINSTLEEGMRKLPPGATRDDYIRDPRIQHQLDRDVLLATARGAMRR